MRKSQIIILAIAIIAVIFLFNMPKFLVKDEREAKTAKAPNTPISTSKEDIHSTDIPEKELKTLNDLTKSYLSVSDKKKKINFADSLSTMFRKVNKYDSSAKYLGEIARLEPTKLNIVRAGDAYFDASTFAIDQNKSADLGEKAKSYYKEVLDKEPGDLEVKTKYAKTFFGGSDPQNTMQGVRILKEVISKDPDNEGALFALGTLSIQSQQFDKAVGRFEALVNKNPKHMEGQFWLGFSYMKLGEKKKAKEAFEKTKQLSNDPEVNATVDAYLKELK